jgi:hypothetical protein
MLPVLLVCVSRLRASNQTCCKHDCPLSTAVAIYAMLKFTLDAVLKPDPLAVEVLRDTVGKGRLHLTSAL